jgi:hypothetical protein
MLMTKNAAGELTVPLSPGEQTVVVQHRQGLRRLLGFAFGSLAVPQLTVPATTTSLTLSYPGEWIPLYESFASQSQVWTVEPADFALFVLLALWIERLLAWLTVAPRRRITIALLTALAATVVSAFLVLVLLGLGVLTILWISTRTSKRLKFAAVALVAVGVALAFMVYVAMSTASKNRDYSSANVSSVAAPSRDESGRVQTAPQSLAPAHAYQGLPAKFTLPAGEHWSSFSQELMRVDRPQTADVVVISTALTKWPGLAVALVAVALIWRERQRLGDAIRESRLASQQRPPMETPAL